jgi:tetratricopeptide (TPR) repeat protein
VAEGREKDRGANPEEEIGKYRAILEKDPQSRVFAPLAEAYRKAGYLDEAIETARAGLDHHPSYLSGRVALARALFEKGESAEAKSEISQVIQAAPDNLMAHKLIGQVHLQGGDPAAAEKSFNMVLLLDPRDQEAQAALENLKAPAAEPVEPPPVESVTPAEEAPAPETAGAEAGSEGAPTREPGEEGVPSGLVFEDEEGEPVFEQTFDEITGADEEPEEAGEGLGEPFEFEEAVPAGDAEETAAAVEAETGGEDAPDLETGDAGEDVAGDADVVSTASLPGEEAMFDRGPAEPQDDAPFDLVDEEADTPDVESAEDLFDGSEEELQAVETTGASDPLPAEETDIPFEMAEEEEPDFMDSPEEAAEIGEDPFSFETDGEDIVEITAAEDEGEAVTDLSGAEDEESGDIPFDLTEDEFAEFDSSAVTETAMPDEEPPGPADTSFAAGEGEFEQAEASFDLGEEEVREAEAAADFMVSEEAIAEESTFEPPGTSPAEETSAPPAAEEPAPVAEPPGIQPEPAGETEAAPAAGSDEEGVGDAFNTETLAHLYVRQGFYDKAAGVYEAMLRDNPADTALRQKLEEARALAGMMQGTPSAGEPAAATVPPATEAVGPAADTDEHPAIVGLKRFLEQLKERKP